MSQDELKRLRQITKDIIDINLNKNEKSVIEMTFGLGDSSKLSEPEIAETLGISVGKVKILLSKALRKLRKPSLSSNISELFPNIEHASITLKHIQTANLSFEQNLDVIKSELPSLFPGFEKYAKSNEGLLKLSKLILTLILFVTSHSLIQNSSPSSVPQTIIEQNISTEININQKISVRVEKEKKLPKRKVTSKSKPKKDEKPCE